MALLYKGPLSFFALGLLGLIIAVFLATGAREPPPGSATAAPPFTFVSSSTPIHVPNPTMSSRPPLSPSPPTPPIPFIYSFNVDGVLEESESPTRSRSPYWWLDSGGRLAIKNGIGETIQWSLDLLDPWYIEYRLTNPEDTDKGAHPQNVFRLVSKSQWHNARVQFYFRIKRDNFSESPNRNDSNGVLLMSRYVDGDTLYYAGVRVDGTSVIKKKYKGVYYTMAQQRLFPGTYARNANVSLLPHNEWMGLRVETRDQDGAVSIRLYLQRASGEWKEVARATDDGTTYGGTPVIGDEGRVGIRTDFMDVQFKEFKSEAI